MIHNGQFHNLNFTSLIASVIKCISQKCPMQFKCTSSTQTFSHVTWSLSHSVNHMKLHLNPQFYVRVNQQTQDWDGQSASWMQLSCWTTDTLVMNGYLFWMCKQCRQLWWNDNGLCVIPIVDRGSYCGGLRSLWSMKEYSQNDELWN